MDAMFFSWFGQMKFPKKQRPGHLPWCVWTSVVAKKVRRKHPSRLRTPGWAGFFCDRFDKEMGATVKNNRVDAKRSCQLFCETFFLGVSRKIVGHMYTGMLSLPLGS